MKITDVIKYEGDNSTFIWKHPSEDFNCLSQLIVHESQEALFYMNGQALDLFGPGRHTLKSQNIPMIGNVVKLATDGVSPFHCEVYFINKTEQMAILWGTDSKIQYMEPTYNFPISIGASGEMTLIAEDSRKLLLKIVGTEEYLGQQQIVEKFRAFLMTKVKSYIAQIIREKKINIFEIDERLMEFSDALHQMLIPDFKEYGVRLERFFVTTIVKPDGERQYEEFKDLHFRQFSAIRKAEIDQQVAVINANTEAQKKIIESQALAQKRLQEGYTYQQERGFDVASEVARNEAVGQFTNMGVGLGTMAGVGGAVGGVVANSVNSAFTGGPAPSGPQPPTGGAPAAPQGTQPPAGGAPAAPQEAQPPAEGAPASPQDAGGNAATLICSGCGTALPAGAKFCLNCGQPQNAAPICPGCGTELPAGAKFCLNCGEKLL